jgi:acetamidase/formamidase
MRSLTSFVRDLGLQFFVVIAFSFGCSRPEQELTTAREIPEAQFFLSSSQTHNKFSRAISPVLRVPSGAVIQAETKEATDGQLHPDSRVEDINSVAFDPIHPLTGPVYVEGAAPGDILAVTLHKIELGDWGWAAIFPGFGFLADEDRCKIKA